MAKIAGSMYWPWTNIKKCQGDLFFFNLCLKVQKHATVSKSVYRSILNIVWVYFMALSDYLITKSDNRIFTK